MRGMPYTLQGEGGLEIAGFASGSSSSEAKCKKEGSCASNEPISVLDTRRSPSPSTSTSTLSSSFGGSGGGTGGGAAVPDNSLPQKWSGSAPPETGSGDATEPVLGGGRKDEWEAELQPIPAGLEVCAGSSHRFGLGLEDWESLLSESAASPGHDHTLLRWISGDVDDSSFSLKQLLQGGNPNEIDGNAAVAVIDQTNGFEPGSNSGNVMTSSSSLAFSGSGFSLNNNNNGKFVSASTPTSSTLNTNPQNPSFSSPQNQFAIPDHKLQIFYPQMMINQPQVQSTVNTQQEQHQFQPHPKRHNPGIANYTSQIPKAPFEPGHEFLIRKQPQLPQLQQPQEHQRVIHFLNLPPPQLEQKPFSVPMQEHQQVIHDQLHKAAELLLAGNFSHAQLILARLNHQLSPISKSFQRAAFYFKEALEMPLLMPNSVTSLPPRTPTPFDCMFKMGAYEVLSDISPLLRFVNFTSNQTLLEALDDAECIHIVDFDIGFGAQWASFMKELPRRNGAAPSLKITAFASPTTHHPLEIGLMHESLTQFAHENGVSFELEVVNFDSFDPNSYSMSPFQSSENEAIAVNFPIWSCSSHLAALPSVLRFIKQLSPKIMVSLERGCERNDLPFSQHLLCALQYYEGLLDSIDAASFPSDTANKIERFLFQPRIESMVLGRLHFRDQIPHWKSLFASVGFSPVMFSSSTETQAELLLKTTQVRGFHVEKRQASLVLCWQRRELMAASAWKC